MCINPAELPDGTKFGCRKCWQCRENAIQDWVGRCIAQSKTSSHTYSTTVTYGGGDHERATVLTYSDVQKYFKRLRKAGFKFKYLVAGEYGTVKGRAHWHMILFFQGAAPKHELRKNFMDPFWPHGWSFWDEPNAPALRYVCKYIKKAEDDDEAQAEFRMSKKPPIGSEYFTGLAADYVRNGLSPKTLKYDFAENTDKNGARVQHMMQGATARDFLQTFVDRWQDERGNDRWPHSTLVEEFVDKLVGFHPEPAMEKRYFGVRPTWLPRREAQLEFSQAHNSFFTRCDGVRYWWRPLDPSDRKGEHAWLAGEKTVRWEQSDRYRDLRQKADSAKREWDRLRSETLQASGVARSQERVHRRLTARRLPMVGDRGWSQSNPPPRP